MAEVRDMSNMENDAKKFLRRIVITLTLGLLWLFINMTMGIYNGWLFFHTAPTPGNYIFYGWMLLSLIGLLIIYYRIWREDIPHG